jgi:hypothetical protein
VKAKPQQAKRAQPRQVVKEAPAPPPLDPLVEQLQAYARRPVVRWGTAILVLVFFAINGVIAARTNTPTPDEFAYLPEGYYHLRSGDLGFDTSNPPLLKMAMALPLLAMDLKIESDPRWHDNQTGWAPWILGTQFMELNHASYLEAFFRARLVILAIGVALGILLFQRAETLLSPLSALAVIVLYGSLPPVLAHSAVATLDIGVTALVFAAFVALREFVSRKAWSWAALTGVLFGLAFVVKGVAALFVPLVPLLLAAEWGAWDRSGIIRLVDGAVAMLAAAWLAVLAAYGFSGFPLPAPLIEGVRFQMAASSGGELPAFLNGAWSPTGWWYYYLEVVLLKTPIATLVLLAVGVFEVARRWRRELSSLWIVIPPLFLIYILSFHYAKEYGVRYLLPAFPFLLLLAGRGVDALLRWGRYGTAVVGVLLAWQVAACTLNAPHHIAYFNELAGGPDHARHLLLDSNLDWGQDLGRLKEYLDAQGMSHICLIYFGHVDPRFYGIDYFFPPTQPTPGWCALSANFLGGSPYSVTYVGERILQANPNVWTWFDQFKPVARVGRSIYIFNVTEEDIARAAATKSSAAAPR